MTNDLVRRLREEQPVTQDMESTSQCDLQDEAADRIAELEAERDELAERVNELQHACEVVSSEFEGELWQSCRRLLRKTGFDFHGADVDGIQADNFESHINETLVEREDRLEAAIKDAQEAEAYAAELEANINTKADWIEATINDMAAQDQELHEMKARAEAAEAKVAKAVAALDAMLPATQQMPNPKMENTIRAALAELKGPEA